MATPQSNEFVGKYPLVKLLGKGGMGEVWLSHHPGLDIPVAVKILKDFESKSQLNRFIEEGRIAASINHDNIVRVYDADSDGDKFFIVMEFIKGVDYKEFAAKCGGRLSVEQGIELGMAVCSALSKAHEKRIFHRDIKPENVMRSESGEIKLADLGIAKREDSDFHNTIANTPLGTPYYISPEQAYDASTVDCRTDIYSLGATLYYLLTGTYPFKANTPMQMMMKHINESLEEPVKRNPAIPQGLSEIIMKMMEKDREKRFQTCDEVHNELSNFKSTYNPADSKSATQASSEAVTMSDPAEETMDSSRLSSSDMTLTAPAHSDSLEATEVDMKNTPSDTVNPISQTYQTVESRPPNYMPFYVSLAVIFLMFVLYIFKDKLTGPEVEPAPVAVVNDIYAGGGTDVLEVKPEIQEPEIPKEVKPEIKEPEIPKKVKPEPTTPKVIKKKTHPPVKVEEKVIDENSRQKAKEEVQAEIPIALDLLESGAAMTYLQRYYHPSEGKKYGLKINGTYFKWFRKYQEKMYIDIFKQIAAAKPYFAAPDKVSYKVNNSFTDYLKKAGVKLGKQIPDPPMYINFVKYNSRWHISEDDSDPLVKDKSPVYDDLAKIAALLKNRNIDELLQTYTHPKETVHIPEYQQLFQDENYYLLYTALSLSLKRMGPVYNTKNKVSFKINGSMYLNMQFFNGQWYVMDSEESPF